MPMKTSTKGAVELGLGLGVEIWELGLGLGLMPRDCHEGSCIETDKYIDE
jgi:hypothetical protein